MAGPVVGVDVGENSVGLASILVDDDGMPTAIHRLLVVIHDGGKDGMASGQTASVSRKASGGTARRVRRLFKNRRKRGILLAKKLRELGYPLVDPDSLKTYDEWNARLDLLSERIEDDAERRRKLSIAIRHMSNHRGWANAWVPLDSYLWREEPSKEFEAAADALLKADRFGGIRRHEMVYQADLAGIGLAKTERLRPRLPTSPGSDAVSTDHLLGVQRRVDVVREWRQICRVQLVPDEEFAALAKVAFSQEKPTVPVENVGNDWLPGFANKKRASVASLEHQEFQIRQTVANLAIRERPRSAERHRLSVDEQNLVVDTLMGVVSKEEAPTWKAIAEEFLQIEPNLLVHNDPEQSLGAVAPVMRSVTAIQGLPKSHPILKWWKDADPGEQSDFILWFADPAKLARAQELDEKFGPMFEALDDKQFEAVLKMQKGLPSGRSAHSLEAIRMMNAEMARTGDTYIEVRNRLFNGGDDLRPPRESLDDQADHPTLQRILPVVRRFVIGVDREVGRPQRVVIEHVRDAFLGFTAKQEAARRQGANRRDRERARQDIASAGIGIDSASDSEIRKFQAIRRQGSRCLYCGGTLSFGGTDLDHIVPRASGGNSTRGNLVAVCRDCNAVKGKQPFATFAESGRRSSVSLDGALKRVDELEQGELDRKVFWRMKAEMKRRLKQTELDDPIDERALGSTAYAAVDMRNRIDATLGEGTTKVYSGKIVSMARHASGIDKRITIRDGIDVKSRFDRRHHAIDAAVAALVTPAVAKTLAERDDLRRSARDTDGQVDWAKFEERLEGGARESFLRWKQAMHKLADLVEDELRRDEVVVMQPIRVSAHHAALHEDGRKRHDTKRVGEAWSSADRARIVDDRVYEALSVGVKPSADLPADSSRSLALPSGSLLDADGKVFVFPDTSARIALPNRSSAKLGSSIHHIRLYRWDDPKGRRKAGVVRMWASDLYDLEGGVRGDLLTSPLRETSRAARRAHPALRDALHAGIAELVGALVPGDEMLLEPEDWPDTTELGRFLKEWPERHWRLVGWPEDGRFAVNPILLSSEGVRSGDESGKADPRKVAVTTAAAKVISDRVRQTASDLWAKPSTRVVRRTATGKPREGDASGLPSSWSPYEAVYGD